ncbi:MAG: hypothetical protein GIX02_05560 [Candidatus Eremiobacteraeota bacterium]|nr:hypothetical protein [Candidatus Eremiobacteraeota bacterium]
MKDNMMQQKYLWHVALVTGLLAAFGVASCGGGGGTAGGRPGGGGASPTPMPTTGLGSNMQVSTGGSYALYSYGSAANAQIVFSCGCSRQAGTTTADANGNFTVPGTTVATPAAPSPTYTIVPTRNYMIVALPLSGQGPQGWTMEFAGTRPSHNLALGDRGSVPATSSKSDVFTAAAALYVYGKSPNGVTAYDDWNFNAIQSFVQHLVTAPNGPERTLLDAIASRSAANGSLFPSAPAWNAGQPIDAAIATDIANVSASRDPALPTPCPGGDAACTGTPTP